MKSIKKYFVFSVLFLGITASSLGQNDLMDLFADSASQTTDQVIATFKSTRIMNGHSIERMKAKQLDFRVHHRFGQINSGSYNFWGLDESVIRLGLEYGINDWLMVGIGRSSLEKTADGFAKFSLLRQSTGKINIPVSVSCLAGISVEGMKHQVQGQDYYFSNRLAYCYQVMVARKFNESFSLQLTPAFIHYNLVKTELDPNNLPAIGVGGRIKLNKRVSFNAEYFYVIEPYANRKNYDMANSFTCGFDIETGGHVFQIVLTNSNSMIEKGFIGQTPGKWQNGDIQLGFNISRVFTLK